MVKAVFLTKFKGHGYSVLKFPFGQLLHSTLAKYFNENASREDARHISAISATPSGWWAQGAAQSDACSKYNRTEFNTLDDSKVLLHFRGTNNKMLLAATYVYRINSATFAVTYPRRLTGPTRRLFGIWIDGCSQEMR